MKLDDINNHIVFSVVSVVFDTSFSQAWMFSSFVKFDGWFIDKEMYLSGRLKKFVLFLFFLERYFLAAGQEIHLTWILIRIFELSGSNMKYLLGFFAQGTTFLGASNTDDWQSFGKIIRLNSKFSKASLTCLMLVWILWMILVYVDLVFLANKIVNYKTLY